MTLSALGTIEDLQYHDKGYHKLIVSTPLPYETKLLRFCVWKTKLLQNKTTADRFKVGDKVKVAYHLKDSCFPCLDELEQTNFDNCPICDSALQTIDTQRVDCDACSILPTSSQKEKLSEPMKLVSCARKDYQFSTGYRIELLPKGRDKPYVCVIFPKLLLYAKMHKLIVGNTYNVVAWRHESLLDVLDIC